MKRNQSLPSCPNVALPITTSFMLAERDAGNKAPRVLVDYDTRCRWVLIFFLRVPANVTAANDLRRRAGSVRSFLLKIPQAPMRTAMFDVGYFPPNTPPDEREPVDNENSFIAPLGRDLNIMQP